MEQEVKLRQLSVNEADSLDRDVVETNKQNRDIETRIDRFQSKAWLLNLSLVQNTFWTLNKNITYLNELF